MKKTYELLFCFLLFLALQSCNQKKLIEVVEVPLPTAEEKQTIGSPDDVKADEGAFNLEKLNYKYDALAPSIGSQTLELHYSKHYLSFVNNLNRIIKGTDQEKLTIEEILNKLDVTNTELRNNAGGYYNHTLYWKSLSPKAEDTPKDTLASTINRDFGNYESFKTAFKNSAKVQFGSGWTWLVVDKTGKLQITNTQNQDNPLMPNATVAGTPILALDLWEHAYYLDYQNKKRNYIDAFFDVVDWKKASERFEDAIKK